MSDPTTTQPDDTVYELALVTGRIFRGHLTNATSRRIRLDDRNQLDHELEGSQATPGGESIAERKHKDGTITRFYLWAWNRPTATWQLLTDDPRTGTATA